MDSLAASNAVSAKEVQPRAGSKRRRSESSVKDSADASVVPEQASESTNAVTSRGAPDAVTAEAPSSVVGDSSSFTAPSASAAVTGASIAAAGRKRAKLTERGVSVSSRVWKKVESKRTSASSRSTGVRKSGIAFKLQKAEKTLQTAGKAIAARLKSTADDEAKRIREKREEKRRRRAENEFKSTSFQKIDPTKMKRMSKKELRSIKKTRLNKDGVVQLVPAYS